MKTLLLAASALMMSAAPAAAQSFSDTFTTPGSLIAPKWESNQNGQIVAAPDNQNALNFRNTASGSDLVSGVFNLAAGQYRVSVDYLCTSGTTCGGYLGLIGAFGARDGWFATDDQSAYPVQYTFANSSTTAFTRNVFQFSLSGGGYRFKLEDFNGSAGNVAGDAYFRNLSIAAVPEPATWGMMILGFAAVGVTARRRSTRGIAAVA